MEKMEILKIKCILKYSVEYDIKFMENGMIFTQDDVIVPYCNIVSIYYIKNNDIEQYPFCRIKTVGNALGVLYGISYNDFNKFHQTYFKYHEKWLKDLNVSTRLDKLERAMNEINQKLDALFYAPGLTGYHEAKNDFEKSVLML